MSKLTYLFASLLLIALLSTHFVLPASAQTTNNFDVTVSPVFFDLTAKPGTTVDGKVRLRNNTTSPLPIKVEVKKLGGDENGELTIQNAPDDTLNWFEVKNAQVTAPPNEWLTVPFTITVPQNAAYGYYWALSFNQDQKAAQKGTGATVNASIVVPVLLNVNKAGAKTEGKIAEFKTNSSWYEYLPVDFTTVFANTGNVHVRPKGNIFIKDWKGTTVATLDVNPNDGAVLPGTKKEFTTSWNDSFIWYQNKTVDGKPVLDKNGKPDRELKIRFDKILDLRIGKYTATSLVVISSGTRDIALEKSVSFFVFPWKIVLGSIFFVLFAALGIFSTAKTLGRNISRIFKKK
jgi:hypothetical protein